MNIRSIPAFSYCLLLAPAALLQPSAQAAISYTTAGSVYLENFDSLPNAPGNNLNIQTAAGGYTSGWQDDSTVAAGTSIGVPGWYLYHPLAPTASPPALPEGGTNGHQRVRIGTGANTGGFWAFGQNSGTPEMALGSLGSATVADNNESMFTGLRIINNTAGTLTSFTLTFDGEQWRDGASTSGETLSFAYSTSAAVSDWFDPGTVFTSVAALNFTAPVTASTTGAQVDGNNAGLVSNISATITGLNWQPGTELWLRWADPQLPSLADDGLAIDNVRFSAVPEPSAVLFLAGAACAAIAFRRPRSQRDRA